MNIQTLGGTRFIATIGCGIATTFLQYMGKLDPAGSTYNVVILGTVGAFILGRTVQAVKAGGAGQGGQ